MSTGHMPDPPTNPSSQVPQPGAQTQQAPPEQTAPEPAPAPLPLPEDMARIIESQADVIVQRMVYHTQMMVGVSALGTDPVNARNTTLVIANALRSNQTGTIVYSLVNLGDPQIAQVNDHTTPFRFNGQVAGLMEGILVDTLNQAYKGDPERQSQARAMLEELFIRANEQMEGQSRAMLPFFSPGPHPNARQ